MRAVTGDQAWAEHRDDLIVECPSCYSTRPRCRRPSGHAAQAWHVDREDAYAQRCGCTGCRAWLALRDERGER